MQRFSSLAFLTASLLFVACGGDDVAPSEDAGARADAGPDARVADSAVDARVGDGSTPDLGIDGGGDCDIDGDGREALACGGDDCDDADAERFPSNPEVCDAPGHDEDCNPTTLGPDGDADTFASTSCCNLQNDGSLACGFDCNDASPDISPTAPESCNGVDDNCNGLIDEGVLTAWYVDSDGDGYGALGTTMIMMQCTRPTGYSPTSDDCDDVHRNAHPGATEVCDAYDNTCNGTIDEGCICVTGTSRMCGAMTSSGGFYMTGPCHPGMQTCVGAAWGPCMGNVDPVTELCSTLTLDDNCNGVINEPTAVDAVDWYPDVDRDGYGNRTAAATRQCIAPSNTVRDNTDCNDVVVGTHPGSPETCDGVDNNCTLGVDELPAAAAGCPDQMFVATTTCTAAACAVGTCDAGRGDCDRLYTSGCEVNTTVTTAHCGMCGLGCTFACTASACDPVIGIGAGGSHTCAVRGSRQVACWGRGGEGQLGDATSVSYNSPRPIPSMYLADAASVSGGAVHTCALRTTGAVSCWGQNLDGQLGTGDRPTSWNAPRGLNLGPGVTGATSLVLSPSGNVSCVITTTGQAKCWGRNVAFQLGDGAFNTAMPAQRFVRAVAVNVSGLTNAIAIAPGQYHACAIRSGGQAVCWGTNGAGELGDGVLAHFAGMPLTREGCTDSIYALVSSPALPGDPTALPGDPPYVRSDCHNAPVSVSGIADAVAITVGGNHSCAIRTGGQVACWGYNGEGRLGDGTVVAYRATPAPVTGLTNAVAIAAASTATCAIRMGGQVACWGDNSSGQLGNGTTGTPASVLVNVTGLTNATSLTAGANHFCAVRTTGQPICWGLGFNGQLGTGVVTDSNVPVNVLPLP